MASEIKRPVSYKDWRALWHQVSMEIGFHVQFCFDGKGVKVNKYLSKLLNRQKRIYARLQIEAEIRDESWAEAMLELIFDEDLK